MQVLLFWSGHELQARWVVANGHSLAMCHQLGLVFRTRQDLITPDLGFRLVDLLLAESRPKRCKYTHAAAEFAVQEMCTLCFVSGGMHGGSQQVVSPTAG
jgi:hypothetical protein